MDSLAQQEYILSLLFETVVVKKKKKIVFIFFTCWGHGGFPLKIKPNTINRQHSFVLQLFYLLIYFKTRNFTHIILLSFYFSVTVITQIFFFLKSLN